MMARPMVQKKAKSLADWTDSEKAHWMEAKKVLLKVHEKVPSLALWMEEMTAEQKVPHWGQSLGVAAAVEVVECSSKLVMY